MSEKEVGLWHLNEEQLQNVTGGLGDLAWSIAKKAHENLTSANAHEYLSSGEDLNASIAYYEGIMKSIEARERADNAEQLRKIRERVKLYNQRNVGK